MEEQENNIIEKVKTVTKNTVHKIGTAINTTIDRLQAWQKWNAQFEEEGVDVTAIPLENDNLAINLTRTVTVIMNSEEKYFLVRKLGKVSENQILRCAENEIYRITSIDATPVAYPADEDAAYPIECLKCYYEKLTPSEYPEIDEEAVQAVIQEEKKRAMNTQKDLDDIEKAIKAAKVSVFGKVTKKKQEEALHLLGRFNFCVFNNRIDEDLFANFIKSLEVVAPDCIDKVKNIIESINP